MSNLSKKSIAESFSRAAETYDSFAHVQKKTANHLANLLPGAEGVGSILEAGCGTGFYTSILDSRFPKASIIALDIAEPMARTARLKLENPDKRYFLAADAEKLPLLPGTEFDLITSNGVFQWFSNIEKGVRRLAGYVKQDGIMLAAIFGNRTLNELATAIQTELEEDVSIPAQAFPDSGAIESVFASLFSQVEIKERTIARTYPDVPSMLRTLKMTGVAPKKTRPIIRTRGDMEKIGKNYTMQTGRVMASYHVIIVKAWSLK